MTALSNLLLAIEALTHLTDAVTEESRRLTIEGNALNRNICQSITSIFDASDALSIPAPTVLISGESNVDLLDSSYDGEPWRVILGKTPIAEKLKARKYEDTLLFFSENRFYQWIESLDPFVTPSIPEPDFSNPTTIRIFGLQAGFGGELLWVLTINSAAPEIIPTNLPTTSNVHSLIHINAADKSLRVCPKGFAITWGVQNNIATSVFRMNALVLSSCLVQELKRIDGNYEVTLSGTKRVSLPLFKSGQSVSIATLNKLLEAICWVYEERPETRLKLVMDRLSIDSQAGDTLLSCMDSYLEAALQQARDSYAFVILERKDAYHKEMRELMKDMKSQADLYAGKVRELVSSLTRDILGVLVFIGFSFIGKFDQKNLLTTLESNELSLFLKFLACYLALSCALQIVTHWRDSNLGYRESEKWLNVLQNYTSRQDKEDNFLGLLKKRRSTLHAAMLFTCVFYVLLVFTTWNLPCIVNFLLHPFNH
ncbi:MAG: hypothetical protein PHY54_18100 [Methylococcales bacterium]|nr:hypothetical protein [Methylococcales bacterium]